MSQNVTKAELIAAFTPGWRGVIRRFLVRLRKELHGVNRIRSEQNTCRTATTAGGGRGGVAETW